MELESVSRQSLAVTQLVRAQVGSGRIALPVSSNRIYANLKHITGVSTLSDQPAFSLSQLRNLDNLIDRLKLLRDQELKVDLGKAEESDITAMIEKFREELYTELHKKNPYRNAGTVSGLSVNILA